MIENQAPIVLSDEVKIEIIHSIKALKTQYLSDIKRLDFIADGSKKRKVISRKASCPFCGHDMEEGPSKDSYMESAETEIMRINLQLQDLEITEADAQAEIETFEADLRMLNARSEKISKLINQQLRPKARELRATVAECLRILQLRQELASVSYTSTALSVDAFEKTNEEDETAARFNAKDTLDRNVWGAMSESFDAMVKACVYPGNPDSFLCINTADAVVGSRHKKNQGKGYRAFLNTIMLFNLMKCLEYSGRYAPHLLVTVDYSSANLVTFTKTDESGKRYGFLRTKPGSIPEQ